MAIKSIEALNEGEKVRESCKNKIVDLLKKQPLRTDQLIDNLKEYAKSTVTGRISDLNDEGIITPDEEKTSLKTTLYRLTYSHEREEIILERKKERFRQWLNQSEEFQGWMPSEVMRWIQLEARL